MKKNTIEEAFGPRPCPCLSPCPWPPAPAAPAVPRSSGSNSGGASNSGGEDGYKVAIVRQLDHASMNEIRGRHHRRAERQG